MPIEKYELKLWIHKMNIQSNHIHVSIVILYSLWGCPHKSKIEFWGRPQKQKKVLGTSPEIENRVLRKSPEIKNKFNFVILRTTSLLSLMFMPEEMYPYTWTILKIMLNPRWKISFNPIYHEIRLMIWKNQSNGR